MAWELRVRARRASRIARAVAAVLVLFFAVGGVLLQYKSTGVRFDVSDQVAVVLIGVLLAGGVLLLTRPRLDAGPQGVLVRNLFSDTMIEWELVRNVSFPDGKAWARIELPADEYIPVLALRASDKEYAVEAIEKLRALIGRYRVAE